MIPEEIKHERVYKERQKYLQRWSIKGCIKGANNTWYTGKKRGLDGSVATAVTGAGGVTVSISVSIASTGSVAGVPSSAGVSAGVSTGVSGSGGVALSAI
jgi:hypothetical protein